MHAILDRHGLVKRRRRRIYRPEGTALSRPYSPNDLWCADYKGEFMLADRPYCYPLTISRSQMPLASWGDRDRDVPIDQLRSQRLASSAIFPRV